MKRWQKVLAIAALSLIVVVAVLLFVLDSIITSKARDQAAQLSKEWGRPVTIGSVSTKIITGLGVNVSDLRIGAAEGEGAPLLDLKRALVKAALLRAALSGGKDVDVSSAEIDGLTVNVIRLPDGTTNLEALQKKIAESSAPKKEEPKQSDLSFLRIDHAALRDGKIAFIDKSGASARELAIQHLEVTVNDLRAGKPLEIVLKAAVLAEKQNLELRVKAAALPSTLTPTPTTVVLRVDPPIDIGPLGPFAGKGLGLTQGTLDADFDAELGAAVPGGKGPTSVKGTVKLAALRFKAADKPLDVTLDADVKGDAAAGDVQIDRLKLEIGPAGITGKGRARGLTSTSPQIEGLEIVGHDLDPAKLAVYYPPLRDQLKGQISGPIGLDLRASGSAAAQALELKLDFTKVMLAVPGTLTKAAGAVMTILLHAKGAASGGGPLRFDARIDLLGVDLRPGQSVDKAPGQRLDVALDGTRTTNNSSSAPEQKIELADLKAHILADELEGRGWVEMKGGGANKTTQFELSLASSHLDLDKMLIPGETKEEKEEKPLDPKLFAGLSGHAAVKIDRLRVQKQDMTDIVADVVMNEDDIKVNKAELKAFGGSVSASGTEMKLAHPHEPFHVVTKLTGVEAANLLAMATEKKILAGKFSGDIDLKGGGQGIKDLAKTLAGNLDGHVLDGIFYGKDLVASVTGPLAKSLPFGLAGKEGQGGTTSLGKDLPVGVTIENGVAKLKQPIKVTRPEAEMSFTGGIRVDGNLDLPGTISLSPQTVATLTQGRVKPKDPVPVKLRLTGPAWNPSVTDLDLKPAVEMIARQAGSALLGKALGVDNVDQKANEEAQKAQQKGAAEVEAETKKAEDEAKNRLKGLFGK